MNKMAHFIFILLLAATVPQCQGNIIPPSSITTFTTIPLATVKEIDTNGDFPEVPLDPKTSWFKTYAYFDAVISRL